MQIAQGIAGVDYAQRVDQLLKDTKKMMLKRKWAIEDSRGVHSKLHSLEYQAVLDWLRDYEAIIRLGRESQQG